MPRPTNEPAIVWLLWSEKTGYKLDALCQIEGFRTRQQALDAARYPHNLKHEYQLLRMKPERKDAEDAQTCLP